MTERSITLIDKFFSIVPYSILFFVTALAVYVLQWFSIPGIFFMMLAAPFWATPLVNAGLIGIALEAIFGRVWRLWLVVPVVVYGLYLQAAAGDHATLMKLALAYEQANALATVDFDKATHAIVFEESANISLVNYYDLPVEYKTDRRLKTGYMSTRLADIGFCREFDKFSAVGASAASVFVNYIVDKSGEIGRQRDDRVCSISMPEKPELLIVTIKQVSEKEIIEGLPVNKLTTIITMPDGAETKLLGGFAAPLPWWPMPYAGCGLISGLHAQWSCQKGFSRKTFTPVISGNTRFGRDTEALARTLELRKLAPSERKPSATALVRGVVEAAFADELAKQLQSLDFALIRPEAVLGYQYWTLIWQYPETIALRSEAIIELVESKASGTDRSQKIRFQMLGSQLADLLGHLPQDVLVKFKNRILSLYAEASPENWLWGADFLVGRLGDLGIDALPYVSSAPALKGNYAGIEGLCRIGSPARKIAEPILTSLWIDRDVRFSYDAKLYVAMKRIGIAIPEVRGSAYTLRSLGESWLDLSPDSPSGVCTGMVK